MSGLSKISAASVDTHNCGLIGGLDESRWKDTLDVLTEGICVFDEHGRLAFCNRRYIEFYELPAALAQPGTHHDDIMEFRLRNGMRVVNGEKDFRILHEIAKATDEMSLIEVVTGSGRRIAISHRNPKGGGWIATHRDITSDYNNLIELRRSEQQIALQHERLEAAVNEMEHGLAMFDKDRRLVTSNAAYAAHYKLPKELLKPGVHFDEILECRRLQLEKSGTADAYIASRRAVADATVRNTTIVNIEDGRSVLVSHHPTKEGGWVSIHEDITHQLRHEKEIWRLARTDALTGLGNRIAYRESVDELFKQAQPFALFCVDLDNFKSLNDTLGHSFGDSVLMAFASRLRAFPCPDVSAFRLGGDEFALIFKSTASEEEASLHAPRLLEHLAIPYEIQGREVRLGVSVGIALAPGDADDVEVLMSKADLALYRAKNDGRGVYRFFERNISEASRRQHQLESGLRRALSNEELHLAYQPIFSIADNRVCSFEALVRWTDPELGPVSPAEFIPVAEHCGLIARLGQWVLKQACRQAALWPPDIRIAVNLSTEQLKVSDICSEVEAALASSGIAPQRLELEVTETLLLDLGPTTLETIRAIQALGVRLVLDDFGAGYSSLRYLRDIRFDKIKIDQELIRPGSVQTDGAAIYRAIVRLCCELGLRTTAEGIETGELLDFVRDAGCDEAQGYLIAPPLPASAALDLLRLTTPIGQLSKQRTTPRAVSAV